MPRKKPLLSTTVVDDVVEVNSKVYGKHYRKPRGSKTPISINNAFQKSVALNRLANPAAKAIKDALDPFRKEFKDGTMWSRLVGLFKIYLREKSTIDFSILEDFDLYKKPRMGNYFYFKFTATTIDEAEPSIQIELSTTASNKLDKFKVKSYKQTIIIVFLDANQKVTTFSNEINIPIVKTTVPSKDLKKDESTSKANKQIEQVPVPTGAKWALIVAKCLPSRDGHEYALRKLNRIKILKAYAL
ncbi:hypothetical protein BH10BAC4_BH10BAC4_20630 [soil metagenome]